jgi:hypothetical protein
LGGSALQAPDGSAAAAPQTLGGLANEVLAELAPNEQSVLRLAGLAAGAGGSAQSRVPGQGDTSQSSGARWSPQAHA